MAPDGVGGLFKKLKLLSFADIFQIALIRSNKLVFQTWSVGVEAKITESVQCMCIIYYRITDWTAVVGRGRRWNMWGDYFRSGSQIAVLSGLSGHC